jgi:N-acetylglutamate synthase-like GNAT family acetyltransferase
LERSGQFGLLRSVAVHASMRGQGVARRLLETAEAFAGSQGVGQIYLFSKDTASFFEALGWSPVPVEEAAARLSRAAQVIRYNRIGWYPNERALRRDLR